MSANRFHDFDAAVGEREPIRFRLAGKDWELPPTAPAAALLKIDRAMVALAQMEQSGDVPDDYVIDDSLTIESMARSLAGDENVDEWLAAGVDYPTLQAVTQRLVAIYRGEDPDDVGEAEPPNRAARRAAAKKTMAKQSRSRTS